MELDVVVGDQTPSRNDCVNGRRAISCSSLSEVGNYRFKGRSGVAMQGDGIGLDPGKLPVVYVDVDESRRLKTADVCPEWFPYRRWM